MNAEESKNSLLLPITAVVICGILYVISYRLLGEIMVSNGESLFRILFSALLLGPLFLLHQWICCPRPESAVTLWGAYAGGWLMLLIFSQFTAIAIPLYFIFVGYSFAVFLYATFLLSAEIRTWRFKSMTTVATLVTLFSSGQVLVEVALYPIVT